MNPSNTTTFIKEVEDRNNSVETCILCNCSTEYRFNIHIDFRNYYVEGAGQMCKECYVATYEH